MNKDTRGTKTIASETFGARLKRLRIQKRFSLKEMAETIGVPITTYREWEYGRAIKGEPYAKLAKVLEVSIAELLTGKQASKTAAFKQLALIQKHIADLRNELESFF